MIAETREPITQKQVVITGGGTGGHLYPALAVMEALQQRYPELSLHYIGLERERDRREVEKRQVPFTGLPLAGLKRKLALSNVRAVRLAFSGVARCYRLLRQMEKGAVFGVGGYVSAPAMAAGKLLGWKLALHEQNTIPGLVNRLLARQCHRVFTTYEVTQDYLNTVPCLVTGLPLRQDMVEAKQKRPASQNLALPHILVVGGSQGSKRITEVCISVFKKLEEEQLPFQATLQTGERNLAWAQTLQPPANTHLVPFIETMADAYARADLVVCRAGSGTLSELALWEKPAVLIPYPHASENHQKVNADTFARHHAAVTIEEADLTEDTLRRELRRLLRNKETRDAMSRRMAELYKPHAAERIAEEIVRLLQE